MTRNLLVAGNVAVLSAALPAVLCVLIYLRAPWWKTPEGRHLMTATMAIAAILCLSSLRVWAGDAWWYPAARLVVFAGMPVVMWSRLALVVRAQLPRRGGDPPARPQDPQDPHSGPLRR